MTFISTASTAAIVLELVLEGVPTALRDLMERHERIDTGVLE